jgi:hypothetical protein
VRQGGSFSARLSRGRFIVGRPLVLRRATRTIEIAATIEIEITAAETEIEIEIAEVRTRQSTRQGNTT